MKRLTLLTCALLLGIILHAQTLSELDWLKGKWERQNTKPGTTGVEFWEQNGENFKGLGLTMRGKDTVFVEKLKILQKHGNFYYVAKVAHNPAPTYFKIVKYNESMFVCENPAHDFPKEISYSLDADKLKVIISGDGKSIPFIFARKAE